MDVDQMLRESPDYEFLQPYADEEGLVARHRVEGLLARDPWRHTTYEATAPDGRRVALKLFRLRSGHNRREVRRFQQRVRARASIEHPHLLPIFEWGQIFDRSYIAMGLCRAPTLADLLGAAPLKAKGCLGLLGQLAEALEAAHRRGVIHRDLRPEAVVVSPTDGGHLLLGDFGADIPEQGSGLDLSGRSTHASPEELRDEPLTHASNVYSLACILVECLSGSPPYTSDLPGIVAYAHENEPPPRLSERRPELPPALDDVVARALAKDPRERLQSPRALVAGAAAAMGLDSPVLGAAVPSHQVSQGNDLPATVPRTEDAPSVQGPRAASVPRTARAAATVRRAGAATLPRVPRAAVPRNALPLALVVVILLSGVLGFVLARAGDEASGLDRAGAVDTERLEAARERTAAVRSTHVALERLDTRRAGARRRLAAARTKRAQSAAASGLSSAYRTAARGIPGGSGDTARIVSILNDVAHAYHRLSRSALGGRRGGFVAAGRAVERREADLRQAIVRLNRTRRRP